MSGGVKGWLAFFASATVALLFALVFLLWRVATLDPALNTQAALDDPAVRAELVQRLAANSIGIWDTHNDPEVGRMLQANREVMASGVPIKTNALGLREHEIELPKPRDLLRVIVLGDSFVQGYGVLAEDRLGVFLERYLTDHASGWPGRIECLHVGVGGWNASTACAWLRRMLSELAPDLVLHVLVTNDLDDHMGVRGFGELASFAPLTTQHTDALVSQVYSTRFSSPSNPNHLLRGWDYESRHRYEQVAEDIGRLATLCRQSGAGYLAVAHWGRHTSRLWGYLRPHLRLAEFVPLPWRLMTEADLFHGPGDAHWTRAGHETVARLLFTWIRQNGFLPQLALRPWPEVEEPASEEFEEAKAELEKPRTDQKVSTDVVSSLAPARFTDAEWRQVYTGLDAQGLVSPFASLMLRRTVEQVLRLRGRALDRPELVGARVRISVEASEVGEVELVPGQAFDVRFELPRGAIKARGALNVRLETSDYAYAGPERQHCVSFALEELALE